MKCVRQFEGHQLYVSKITFNNNRTKILSASKDKKILEWDIYHGQEQLKFEGHE